MFLILHDRLFIQAGVGWEDQSERFQLGSGSLMKKQIITHRETAVSVGVGMKRIFFFSEVPPVYSPVFHQSTRFFASQDRLSLVI